MRAPIRYCLSWLTGLLLLPWLANLPGRAQPPMPAARLLPPDNAASSADLPWPRIIEKPGPGDDLKPAPLDASDVPLPINLATALRLSDARPLIVVAAQASVLVAQAQLKRANL